MTVSRATSFLAGFALVGALGAAVIAGSPEGADMCRPGYARSMRLPASAYYPIAEEAYRRAGIPWSERHTHVLDHVVGTCSAYCAGEITLQEAVSRFRRD